MGLRQKLEAMKKKRDMKSISKSIRTLDELALAGTLPDHLEEKRIELHRQTIKLATLKVTNSNISQKLKDEFLEKTKNYIEAQHSLAEYGKTKRKKVDNADELNP